MWKGRQINHWKQKKKLIQAVGMTAVMQLVPIKTYGYTTA